MCGGLEDKSWVCIAQGSLGRGLSVNQVRRLMRAPCVSCMGFPWVWDPGQGTHRTRVWGPVRASAGASRIESSEDLVTPCRVKEWHFSRRGWLGPGLSPHGRQPVQRPGGHTRVSERRPPNRRGRGGWSLGPGRALPAPGRTRSRGPCPDPCHRIPRRVTWRR